MCIFYGAFVGNFDVNLDMVLNQLVPCHEKTNILHMRKQRRRSASIRDYSALNVFATGMYNSSSSHI